MGTAPTYLADRADQLMRFRQNLKDFPGLPHNVRVTGLRGVGKTVLLGEYAEEARRLGWVAVEHECGDQEANGDVATASTHTLIQRAVHDLSVLRRLGDSLRRTVDRLRQLSSGLRISYQDLGVTFSEPAPAGARPEAESRVSAALALLGETLHRTRSPGTVFILDEFQIWRDRETRNQFPVSSLVRGIAHVQRQRAGAYPIMLVVGGLEPLIEHLAEAESYTERMFSAEMLGNLHPEEARKAFTEPARLTDNPVEDALADTVVQMSGGYPFFIQFFGAYLWRAADGAGQPLTLKLWKENYRPILAQLDQDFFLPRYSRATRSERDFLGWIAAEGEQTSVERLIARHGLTNSQVQAKVISLVGKGLVYRPDRGLLAFTTPLCGDFVRRRTTE